ncbi:MAG TPA: chemotaxis protein CheW [Phycisphaerae bacterium]|nr:chemotaxis protein CheW [Phycisphaerae bacterium]
MTKEPGERIAAALRTAFDTTFAQPPTLSSTATTALLMVRVAGQQFAIKRSEMSGLAHADNIAPVPGPSAAFLGVTGLRGQILPIWSLAGLMGIAAAPPQPEEWLVLLGEGSRDACAFACETIEQTLVVSEEAFAQPSASDSASRNIQAVVRTDSALVPVLNLPALRASLRPRSNPAQTSP